MCARLTITSPLRRPKWSLVIAAGAVGTARASTLHHTKADGLDAGHPPPLGVLLIADVFFRFTSA